MSALLLLFGIAAVAIANVAQAQRQLEWRQKIREAHRQEFDEAERYGQPGVFHEGLRRSLEDLI